MQKVLLIDFRYRLNDYNHVILIANLCFWKIIFEFCFTKFFWGISMSERVIFLIHFLPRGLSYEQAVEKITLFQVSIFTEATKVTVFYLSCRNSQSSPIQCILLKHPLMDVLHCIGKCVVFLLLILVCPGSI